MTRPTKDELAAWDHTYLWHPFTQMREWLAEPPLIIERAEGNELIDVDGRRYVDGVASLWCNVHGHCRPEINAAIGAQLERVAHSTLLGLTNVPATELARRLIEITPPNLTRVFYSDAGATAVEIALKMAFQYCQLKREPQRTRFASLTEAYHGDTLGAVSVGYSEPFHHCFQPLLFACDKLDPPHVYRWQRGMDAAAALNAALRDAERLLERVGHELVALIVEPRMQGAAGMWVQPPGYVRGLRELTRRHGVLLICDEVATGFGRTGTMFAIEQEGVEPDLLCVGKGITGGYLPLAATFATEEIFSAFLGRYDEFKTFFHGHTYTGNPLACAAALASLDLFETDRVLDKVNARATQLSAQLHESIAPLAHVGDIRQCGLMAGIELVADRAQRHAYAPGDRIGHRVCQRARQDGVLLRPLGSVIIVMPPLAITAMQLDQVCKAVQTAIAEITAYP